MLFFGFQQNKPLFSSLSSNLQPWFKVQYGFVVFYRDLTKLATEISFFVLVASAVATVGPGYRTPLKTACAPPSHFGLLRMLFGASRNDKTAGNKRKRTNNFQT